MTLALVPFAAYAAAKITLAGVCKLIGTCAAAYATKKGADALYESQKNKNNNV